MTELPADPNEAPTSGVAHPENAVVTLQDVRHVAALANLQLTPDEEPRMQHDLNAILSHVAALNSLDTTGVTAMAQVSDMLRHEAALAGAMLRPDEQKPSVDRAAVLHEAPETDGRFFKVPKVIER